jgi:glycosyltransferase involved in cell wall biosynthesis
MTTPRTRRPLRFALMGSRGIPNRYGGYETLMEELAERLVAQGYEVTVYCRSHSTPRTLREHRGAELVVLPTIRSKYLDTPVHTLLSCLHACFRRFDAALMVNSANAVFLPILRLRGLPVALHVDGIEKRRAKWGAFGRWVYAASERLACVLPTELITDAEVIRDHYLERYDAPSTVLTYGVDPLPVGEPDLLPRLGLEPGKYFLYVSRFEPENNPHRVAEAYRQVGGDLPLVMVGAAPYASKFIRGFTEGADARILFPGAIYGAGYRELLGHATAYIQATEVGGTHPALVEAMGYGCCLVVNGTPENREVAGPVAHYFRAEDPESLARVLDEVRRSPDETARRGRDAALRARELYSWEVVCAQYAQVLVRMARKG